MPVLVISLHLFIERPELRDGGEIGIDLLADDLALVGHDLLQQGDVGALLGPGHRHVAIAAHADGDDALVVLVALDAFFPELAQHLGVLRVIPGACAVALPFLLGAQHRLVMRGAHHDAVLVGDLGIERIVFVEGVVPHGRPEIIALQAEDQLEDLFVELVVVGAELLLHPAAERRRFVVQEDAAILDRGLAFAVLAGLHEQGVLVDHGNVGPPIPGRNADLFGEIVDAVDGAALVAARDHQRAGDTGQRPVHHLDQERFPFAGYARGIDLALANQAIDQRALADGAGDHGVRAEPFVIVHRRRSGTGDASNIRHKIAGGTDDARVVAGIDIDRRGYFGLYQGKAAARVHRLDVPGLAQGECAGSQTEAEQQRLHCVLPFCAVRTTA